MVRLASLTIISLFFSPVALSRRIPNDYLPRANLELKQATRAGIVNRQEMLRRGDLRPRGTTSSYPYCPGFSSESGMYPHAVYSNVPLNQAWTSVSSQDNFENCLSSCCRTACSAMQYDPSASMSDDNCYLYYNTDGSDYSYATSGTYQLAINRVTCSDNADNAGDSRACCNAPYNA